MSDIEVENGAEVTVVNVDGDDVSVVDVATVTVIEAPAEGPPGLQGDPGADGSDGAPGSNGTNGLQLRNGSGAPSNGLGVNGEFYIDYTGWQIYGPKAGGVWPAGHALTGPAGVTEFTSGTRCLFQQTSAPTGWTKDTSHNDKALRVVSGAVGSGGSSPFSTVFGKTATDGHSLSIAELAVHHHDAVANGSIYVLSSSAGSGIEIPGASPTNAIGPLNAWTTGDTGSGTAHTHPMDIRVNYVDVIIAQKD